MRDSRGLFAAVFAIAVLALGLVACGGGDGDDEPSPGPAGAPGATQEPGDGDGGEAPAEGEEGDAPAQAGPDRSDEFTPRDDHEDSGGGAEQFRVPGGDNSVQNFGSEADGSDFDQAAAALHNFLDARSLRAWRAACSYLASGTVSSLAETAAGSDRIEGSGCAAGLRALTNPAAMRELRKEAARADVGSVRVEGDRGFLIYTVGETAYALPMTREDGEWKVGALAGLPLN